MGCGGCGHRYNPLPPGVVRNPGGGRYHVTRPNIVRQVPVAPNSAPVSTPIPDKDKK